VQAIGLTPRFVADRVRVSVLPAVHHLADFLSPFVLKNKAVDYNIVTMLQMLPQHPDWLGLSKTPLSIPIHGKEHLTNTQPSTYNPQRPHKA
jgi:hypothetical protein